MFEGTTAIGVFALIASAEASTGERRSAARGLTDEGYDVAQRPFVRIVARHAGI